MNQPLRPTAASQPQGMGRVRRIHFVGAGGAGMSGIAEVLVTLGYTISGSDQNESLTTRRLAKMGATVHRGHDAANLTDVDVVVTSSAIKADNPELVAARAATKKSRWPWKEGVSVRTDRHAAPPAS